MIVVSGANGFLGAHVVCYLLQQGNTVRALKREQSQLHEFHYIYNAYFGAQPEAQQRTLQDRLHWAIADVLDVPALEIALEGAEAVYHCAAVVSFEQKDKDLLMHVNAQGTANMVNVALLHGVKRFCHVSSIAAIGREYSGAAMTEQSKWANSALNSNYAVSKYKAEMEVWRGIEEGLHAVIVNPGVILGIGQWDKGSCKLFDMANRNFPFYTTGINGYVDVQDVARAMHTLMQKPECFGQRYILTGADISIQYLLHTSAQYLNKKKARFEVKPWMTAIGWRLFALRRFFTGKASGVTKETARTSVNHYQYSSSKIQARAGFVFTPIEQTLATICSYLKHYPSL